MDAMTKLTAKAEREGDHIVLCLSVIPRLMDRLHLAAKTARHLGSQLVSLANEVDPPVLNGHKGTPK